MAETDGIITVTTTPKTLEDLKATTVFEKTLTTSDANGQGRIVVPKAQAEAHLPALSEQSGVEISAVDTYGNKHTLRFRYWINNQSRMYLLEGTQDVQRSYQLGIGDVMIFARGADGKFILSGRAGTKDDIHRKAPVRQPSTGSNVELQKRKPKPTEAMKEAKRIKAKHDGQGEAKAKLSSMGSLKLDVICDGVFRAVNSGVHVDTGKVTTQNGHWTAILNLNGETYQAFFDSKDAALEAYNAAGGQ